MPRRGVPGSSLVTAMARNGVEFGIRLSGTGDRWFTAPAPVVDGLLFPGYTTADAAPDLGDSAITETAGLGGFAMAAAPAIVQFVGGAPQDAIANTLAMSHVTLGRNGAFTLPALDFTGTPAGIDARKVVDTGIAADHQHRHRAPGRGHRPDRRRHHPGAARLLRQGGGGARGSARGQRWRPVSRTAVVAVGGNSLILDPAHQSIPDQYRAAATTAQHIAEMVVAGWNVVVTHGSGPQVGFILRRSELAIAEVPPVPMDYAAADLQGAIGYMFQRALGNEFRRRGIDRRAATVVTQVAGRPGRPRLRRSDEADRLLHGPGERADPRPRARLDRQGGRRPRLAARGALALAQGHRRDPGDRPPGQGGLCRDRLRRRRHPGRRDTAGDLEGVEAVIDKDLASAMLARELGADLLLISTGVPQVAIAFGRPEQRWLDRITRAEAAAFLAAGEFAEGSMAPKIRAIIGYLDRPGRQGLITDPPNIGRALRGETGTSIVPDSTSRGPPRIDTAAADAA